MFQSPSPSPVHTTCPYCGVGCGVVISPDGTVSGDAAHPANAGRLCSKGSALGETLGMRGRMLFPEINGRRASWDQVLDLAAEKFSAAIGSHGPESVAIYASGQFLTEDYYVANKLMKGFFGSANIDTNSRLCMASSVAGHVRAFGEDIVPGIYEDIDEADLVVLVGSNAAWCHPVLFRRLEAAKKSRGTQVINIDPRHTASSDGAVLHLGLRPGSDVALFNGLFAYLCSSSARDQHYIENHTNGFEAALEVARRETPSLDAIAAITGLSTVDISNFYELFAKTARVVTLYSQGVNQSAAGTDKVNAIINCHLVTGRIGRPGMGPFSLTGQPNAMGGREVGGLANQLAAHMNFANPVHIDRVSRFWNAARMAKQPGLKAVELFDAVHDGRIKALWIAGTNPAVSLPRTNRIRDALKKCPFVVVADCHIGDTTGYAHVRLPARGWSEKDGTVTNSERRISRQRAFKPAPGEAMPDWWMFSQLGQRMGWSTAFDFEKPAQIFREHAALSAFENNGERAFDIGALADIDDATYESMSPVQWPVSKKGARGGRLFSDSRFSFGDRRARFVATPFHDLSDPVSALRPFILNTGRVRDQWHTMTRTGDVARLSSHTPEPYLDVNPQDALACGLNEGCFARIESAHGAALMRVRVAPGQRRGDVFAAMHWSDENASTGPAGRLAGAAVDPVSGQPELKATAICLHVQPMAWHGILVSRDYLNDFKLDYWCRIALPQGFAYVMAGVEPMARDEGTPDDDWIMNLLGATNSTDLVVYADTVRGVFRFARFAGDSVATLLFLARDATALPQRDILESLFSQPAPVECRSRVLAGVSLNGIKSSGPMVCSCFAVGQVTIEEAIVSGGLGSAGDVGKAVRAGTNCGSCLPEIEKLLRVHSLNRMQDSQIS